MPSAAKWVSGSAIVDLDDTLITNSEPSRRAMEATISAVCGAYANGAAAVQLRAAWTDARGNFWKSEAEARLGRFAPRYARHAVLTQALRRCRIFCAEIDDLLDLYAHVKETETTLIDGAIELVTHLRDNGVGIALVTNGTAREQRAKLARFGLATYFDAILIEEEVGVGKPSPLIFAKAVVTLGVTDSTGLVVIGDDVDKDGQGAQMAGLSFAHLGAAGPCCYCEGYVHASHFTSLSQLVGE